MGPISLDKQYKTRDGREVKLLMVDGGGDDPVIGAFKSEVCWEQTRWHKDGRFHGQHSMHRLDLIEIKPRIKLERWVNVFFDNNGNHDTGITFNNPKDAACRKERIACVKITIDCEEGEGL